MANRVVHFEVEAKDAKRASEFYEKAFGWDAENQGGVNGNYIVVTSGKTDEMGINGGIFQIKKKELNTYRCIIVVDDITKRIADVKAKGRNVTGNNLHKI